MLSQDEYVEHSSKAIQIFPVSHFFSPKFTGKLVLPHCLLSVSPVQGRKRLPEEPAVDSRSFSGHIWSESELVTQAH
jgi:hypothetical protein